MRRRNLFYCGIAALFAVAITMGSCSSGGSGGGGGDKITAPKAVAGMEALYGIIGTVIDNAPEPTQDYTFPDFSAGTYPTGFGVTQSSQTSNSIRLTITLTDFSPPAEGEELPPDIVANGTLVVDITMNTDWSRATFKITGSITTTGIDAKFGALAADCTISCPVVDNGLDEPDQMSGTITVDGVAYDVSKIDMDPAAPSPQSAHYLIPGGESSPSIAYSVNGETWQSMSLSGGSGALRSGATGTGRIVVVGDNGMIYYSDNKEQWTKAASDTNARLMSVAYANGVWVAVGYYLGDAPRKGEILVSTDGATWTKKGPFIDLTNGMELWSVAYGGTKWLAGGLHKIFSSDDNGEAWNPVVQSGIADALYIKSLAYKAGTWYAGTGDWWTNPSFGGIYSSSDGGVNWTKQYTDSSNSRPVNSIFIGSEKFIAVAGKLWFEPGASFSIITSTTGTSWSETVIPGVSGSGISVTGDPDGFIAMSSVGGIVRVNGDGTSPTVVMSSGYGGGGIMYVP